MIISVWISWALGEVRMRRGVLLINFGRKPNGKDIKMVRSCGTDWIHLTHNRC
jgi:hypothetical protein